MIIEYLEGNSVIIEYLDNPYINVEYVENSPIIIEYLSENSPYTIEVFEEITNIVVLENTETQTYAALAKKYRDEAEYYASLSMAGMGEGERKTGIHAGVLKEMSITDDYVYICVVGGDVGVAVWKKFILFQT